MVQNRESVCVERNEKEGRERESESECWFWSGWFVAVERVFSTVRVVRAVVLFGFVLLIFKL